MCNCKYLGLNYLGPYKIKNRQFTLMGQVKGLTSSGKLADVVMVAVLMQMYDSIS